ncbi:phosphatidylglycerol lysyltransferase domain-containing protein [Verrucomicrobium spinosum]|uniref:phosphatidylglycerol lysyltransferase domain-containing protein n=1 Tax=Verrucomicrobium spinosum TaxID=2736 RepID=UPI0001746B91|nr:phosphatidylglycerol lysyltransferase domain-containing protein [Verrucomicrobium spinosum]
MMPSVLRRLLPVLFPFLYLSCLALPKSILAQDQPATEDDIPIPRADIKLAHTTTSARLYEPDERPPVAVMVFGSGDGGWSAWEDAVSHWLRDAGVYVIGLDLREYAAKDYTAELLGRDMATLAAEAASRGGGDDSTPVIYAGWSMGAVQAVPAAAWKERPAALKGIIMLSADSRGRFGLRASDELGVTPTGPGTFSLGDFTPAMAGLRVAQFHGGADFMASTAWIQSLKTPHELYVIGGANHGFDGPADEFAEDLLRGVHWVLGDDSAAAPPPEGELPFGLSPLWPVAALAIGLSIFFLVSKKHSIAVLAWAVTLMGLVDLLEALFQKPPTVLAWMEQWVPLGVTEKSRLLLLLSGLALLSLARGLRRRKHLAWLLVLVLLSVSVVLHLSRAFDWHHALAAAVLLIPLVRWRQQFVARSDAPSVRIAGLVAFSLAFGLMIYGTVGIRQYSESGKVGAALSWADCLHGAGAAVFMQKSELDHDGGREVRGFLATLRTGSLLSSMLVLALLLRPVLAKRHPEATDDERERMTKIIAEYGRDPMDNFALLPDKRCFFTKDGKGLVTYALWRKYAVALADPICPPEGRAAAVAEFRAFCRNQDWQPIFYCVHVSNRPLYEEEDFVTFKVGEDARLDVAEFKLEGGKFQNLRTARNKARKGGLTFQWYDGTPHTDHGLEAQLTLISQEWLAHKHGGEMTFDLGAFSIDSIRKHGVAIVRNPEGRIETFATWLPYHQGKGRCLDLMRGRAEARDVLDFLIVEAIDHFKAQGVQEVSLGNAPLANVNAGDGQALECRKERAVQFLFDNFDKFYGYKSLFNFKKKYQPEWQGRYIAYPPGVGLAMAGLAIAGVHLPKGFMGLVRS